MRHRLRIDRMTSSGVPAAYRDAVTDAETARVCFRAYTGLLPVRIVGSAVAVIAHTVAITITAVPAPALELPADRKSVV